MRLCVCSDFMILCIVDGGRFRVEVRLVMLRWCVFWSSLRIFVVWLIVWIMGSFFFGVLLSWGVV